MNLEAVSDRLNPVLVKELRQGLKSKAFGFSFLVMQGLVAISLLMHCAATESGGYGARIAGSTFWVLASLPLLLFIPLTAINALYSEYKQNTLPLVLLTRLTPWRMVSGKWASLMAQSGLTACAILPYLVLRYFLGGVNVAHDLLTFCILLGASALLCAGGLLLSTVKNPWRAFAIIISVSLLVSPMLLAVLVPLGLFFYAASERVVLVPVQLLLAAAALLHWTAGRYSHYTFELRVGPRIHSILLLIAVTAAVQIAGKFPPALLALPVLVPALAWNLLNLSALAFPDHSLRRRGILVVALLLVGLLATFGLGDAPGPGRLYLLATFTTALVLPAAIVLALRRWINPFVPQLVFVQIMFLLIGGVVTAVATSELKTIPFLLHAAPCINFFLTTFDKGDSALLLPNLAIAAVSLILFAWTSRSALREAVGPQNNPA